MSDVWVQSFTHLKDRPYADQALTMLKRVASLVKPIMRKRSWRLPLLAEFVPDDPNLLGLNVNQGEQILLRLRPAWTPDTFFDIENVVHTMLHELTHNVHGQHDAAFHSYLSGLEDEYSALKRSGYAGEGFFSPGRCLGENVNHNIPPHLVRVAALSAAEERRRLEGVMGGGGRLGGVPPNERNLSPRDLAAWAAEQRARAEKACSAHSGANARREVARAAEQGIANSATGPAKGPGPSAGGNLTASSSRPPPIMNSARPPSHEWSCDACTLINPPLALQCQACFSQKPSDSAVEWSCMTCTEKMPQEFPTCSFCGSPRF